MRLPRARLGALLLPFAFFVGCGSESSKPTASPDGGAGGAGGADAGGEAGTGTGGGQGRDKTPPVFKGASGVDVSAGEDRVIVTWEPATDPPNPDASKIAYRVYRSSVAGGEDYSHTRRCGDPAPDAGAVAQAELPCYVTAATGTTSVVVRDVIPSHTFYYVARAIDESGNEDKNTKEVSAETTDGTAPDFGGVRSVTVVSATSIKVGWGAGFDLGTPDSELSFHVFVQADGPPDPTKPAAYVSKPGERSTVITGLDPSTPYKVMVRAFDSKGNTDANKRILGVTTPEGIPPTFNGLRRASAEGTTSIRLFWALASDAGTPTPSIVYDVYQALVSRQQKYGSPPVATSKSGATSILLENLLPSTRYYYVVRARDFAGNQDANTKEVAGQTEIPDTSAPTFAGTETVTGSSPTSVAVTWSIANDDQSLLAGDFTYLIYASASSPVPLTTPSLTVRGSTSATLLGLTPGTTYNVVVVAEDAAGNQSAPTAAQSGTTLAAVAGDTTPPILGAAPAVKATRVISPATRMNVTWTLATDNTYAASDIRYHVCASTAQADCQGARFVQHIVVTTPFGPATTTAQLNFLTPHTLYYVSVRSEDRAGNLETADHFSQDTTATSWTTNVKHILFDRCIACHDTFDQLLRMVNFGASYTDPTACTSVPDGGVCQLKIVDPGRPEFSYLYRKVNAPGLKTPPFSLLVPNRFGGSREPRDTIDPLTVDEDDILRTWISQGALGN